MTARIRRSLRSVALLLIALAPIAVGAPPTGTSVGTGFLADWSDRGTGEPRPPIAAYLTGEAARRAVPTNQWYSSVIFERWSHPVHAHPMTYRAAPEGFEIGLPARSSVAERGIREIRYEHVPAITIAVDGVVPEDARLAHSSDWLAEYRLADRAGRGLSATMLHGSPFSYFAADGDTVRFHLHEAPQRLVDPAAPGADGRVAELRIGGRAYAIFAPSASTWTWAGAQELVLHLPAGRRYFSVAGLPDEVRATLDAFLAVAYAFPVDTRVEWSYDPARGTVTTTFRIVTTAKEGTNRETLLGLYPHQWHHLAAPATARYTYDTVRGPLRLIAADHFATRLNFHGVLPAWGAIVDPSARTTLATRLHEDLAGTPALFERFSGGTYWTGKALGAVSQLVDIAEAEQEPALRDRWLAELRARLEYWFDGRHAQRFEREPALGTVLGFPQEFESVVCMNDHHFHYGYWILAAATVARHDPGWAAASRWGGMVDTLVADIATAERGRRDFPFLRNFDPYEGHSWASGLADRPGGNNQESSSEAVNAWAALILWAEATGNRPLRDLGVYLYTTEIASIEAYWFDAHHEVFPPEYGKSFAALVFGGKYAYNTWWTQEPRQIFGINLLPLTPASTYLGRDPARVRAMVATLPAASAEFRALGLPVTTPPDIWQDIIAGYAALADPAAGLALWDRAGTVEFGETRSHTLYWLTSLAEMGTPDFSVTADTTLYGVFRNAAGARSYLAFNPGDRPLRVRFSTGRELQVAPRALARAHD